MSFGISSGLAQMYGSGDRLNEAKTELATMQMFKQQIDADKEKQQQAQLQEQEHLDQISRMSDKFLAPDRNKINEKSKELAKIIQNQVRMHGGDTKKFFDEGGHRYINQYKSEILNSPEVSQAMQNKENMERILQLQMNGMHAKLNPYDLKNLERYEREGGGEITFTGLMTDVKMPDPNLFGYDEMIPAEAILYYPNNKLAIMGNFKLSNPDHEGEPTEAELLQFTREHYQSKGGNQQSGADLRREREAKVTMGYGGVPEGSGMLNKEAISTVTGGIANVINRFPDDVKAEDYINGTVWDKHASSSEIQQFTNGDWISPYVSHNPKETTLFDVTRDRGEKGMNKVDKWLSAVFNDRFSPASSKRVFKGRENAFARYALGVNPNDDISEHYDPATKTLKNFGIQGNGFFTVEGTEVVNTKIDIPHYQRDYQVKGVVTVGHVASANIDPQTDASAGRRNHLLMNVVDKNGNVNTKKSEEWNKYLGDGEVSNKMALVLEDPKNGVVFYKLLDTGAPDFAAYRRQIGEDNDVLPEFREAELKERDVHNAEAEVKQSIQQYETFWSNVGTSPEVVGALNQELKSFSRDNMLDGVRNNLLKSFYAAEAQGNQAEANDAEKFRHATNQAVFTERVNEFNQDYGVDVGSWLRQYQKYPDQRIIEDLMIHDKEKNNGAGASFYNSWLRNLVALKNL